MHQKICTGYANRGFGLIEILIAVAVIAGAALIVASYISTSSTQQIQVRGNSECSAVVSSILAKLKEADNNTIIDNWLPKSNSGFPPGTDRYLTTRMTKMIFNNFTNPEEVLNSTVLAAVGTTMDGPYTAAENNLKLSANNYQLIYSTSSLLGFYYRTVPNICSGALLNRSGPDYLASLTANLDPATRVSIKLNILDADASACEPWDPIPNGVQTPTTGKSSFALSLTLTYPTNDGEESCTGNASFYVGGDLEAPQLDPQLISSVAGFNEISPSGADRIFCGPSASPALTFNVAQAAGSEQPGTQFLCRLDYEGRQATSATLVHPFRSTGWFICSIPERPIEALSLPGGSNLNVLSTSVSDGNAPAAVQFIVNNWVEGTYKFHVKAIDIARNESIRSQKFFIDTSRPNLTLTPPSSIVTIADPTRTATLTSAISSLPGLTSVVSPAQRDAMRDSIVNALSSRLYQCTNSFDPWTIDNTETLEVTAPTIIRNYHASNIPVRINCNAASQNIPSGPWPSDGPHMIQAIACDLCGSSLAVAQTWYVDTASNFAFTPAGNLASPASAFIYNAGANHQNPYALLHEVYGTRAITAHEYSGMPISFPTQTGIGGECSTNQRGRYCYYAADGCGRIAASASTEYQVGGGGGISHFCPTFSCAEPAVVNNCPANRPYACTCTNDSLRDLNFSTTRAGRYAGDPATPGCTYEESLGVCCRPPRACTLEDGTSVSHGDSITAYISTTASCGQSCQSLLRTCNDGVLSGSPAYGHVQCAVNCCPTGRVECVQGSPGCNQEANGTWCRLPTDCPMTHPAGPYSTANACTTAGNSNCQLIGAEYCGQASIPSCAAGEVECSCGSGSGCPVTPSNGICCKPAGPCMAGPYTLTAWAPVNTSITCSSGEQRVEPPSSYTQTRNCLDSSNVTADANCCSPPGPLSQNATYYSACEPIASCSWQRHGPGDQRPDPACSGSTGGGGMVDSPPSSGCTSANANEIIAKNNCSGENMRQQDWICDCGNTPAATPVPP